MTIIVFYTASFMAFLDFIDGQSPLVTILAIIALLWVAICVYSSETKISEELRDLREENSKLKRSRFSVREENKKLKRSRISA